MMSLKLLQLFLLSKWLEEEVLELMVLIRYWMIKLMDKM